jgi:hypothetical protein
VLGLTMGLRRGEILRLRWDDIDLAGRTLRVRRALQRVDGALRLVETKTRSSRRTPVLSMAARALERHRARQAAERLPAGRAWQDQNLVFPTAVGTPLEPQNVNRMSGGVWRWWRRGDLNPQPPPCKGGALPVELRPRRPPVRAGWASAQVGRGGCLVPQVGLGLGGAPLADHEQSPGGGGEQHEQLLHEGLLSWSRNR